MRTETEPLGVTGRPTKVGVSGAGLSGAGAPRAVRIRALANAAAVNVIELVMQLAFDLLMAQWQQRKFEEKLNAMRPQVEALLQGQVDKIVELREAQPSKPIFARIAFVATLAIAPRISIPAGVKLEGVSVGYEELNSEPKTSAKQMDGHPVVLHQTRFVVNSPLLFPPE